MTSNIFAFFDVDETLINEKSMFTILRFISHHFALDYQRIMKNIASMIEKDEKREDINRFYYRQLKGLEQQQVIELSEQYFKKKIMNNSGTFFISSTNKYLKQLVVKGITPVFVSGSSYDYLRYLADYLSVPHILATKPLVDANKKYTGEILHCMIAGGKKQAVLDFAQEQNTDLTRCYAIGDHISDLPFLEIVGNRLVKSGKKDMEAHAYDNGYKVLL